jgi:hypothetical protein
MPHVHGWNQDPETGWWSYGGRYFAAAMWASTGEAYTATGGRGFSVRIWPRLGDVGSPDPTRPLDGSNGELVFPDEQAARAYVESWERTA